MYDRLSRRPALAALAGGLAALTVPGKALAINWERSAPKPVPDIKMLDRQGVEHGLDTFHGRVVVLNLWATWCAPCRLEMPTLDRLQVNYQEGEVIVLALAVERKGWDAIDAFMLDVNATHLTVRRDPSAGAARALGAQGLPATLVLDRQGREVFRHLGFAEWDSPGAKQLVDSVRADATLPLKT